MGKAMAVVEQNDGGLSDAELAEILGVQPGDEIIAAEVEAEALAELEVEAVTKVAKTKKTKAPKPVVVEEPEAGTEAEVVAKKVKRISTAGMKPSQIIDAKIGDEFGDLAVLSAGDDELKGAKLAKHLESLKERMDTLPKKIGEKVVNVFQHLNNGTLLSVYTVDAIRFLRDNGSMTTSELKHHYADPKTGKMGYSQGTAGAQSSQMQKLLVFLEIATAGPDGKLVANPDSVLIHLLAV